MQAASGVRERCEGWVTRPDFDFKIIQNIFSFCSLGRLFNV